MAHPLHMNSIVDFVNPDDLAQTENLELLSKQVVDGFLSGQHRAKRKGGSSEFAEHRAYSPGDEVRLLDWRVFAKSDRYYIKQFEEETSLQALLVIDASGSMGFGMETISKFQFCQRAALCLARLVLQQHDSAGLAIIGGGIRSFVPPRSQPRHLEVLIESVRQSSPSGQTSLANDLAELVPRIKRRGLIIIFSDCFDNVDQLNRSLRLLRSRRHEVLLFHVMAPEELAFSFRERTRFESLEDEAQKVDLDPMDIRGEYLDRLKMFLGQVRHTCGETSCDYAPLSTDQPLGEALANYLRRRAATLK